jgi:hypothetical protein
MPFQPCTSEGPWFEGGGKMASDCFSLLSGSAACDSTAKREGEERTSFERAAFFREEAFFEGLREAEPGVLDSVEER